MNFQLGELKIMLRFYSLLLAMFICYAPLQASWWNSITDYFKKPEVQVPAIKVLIKHDIPKAQVEVKGEYSLYDPYDQSNSNQSEEHISSRYAGKQRYMEALSDGLKWGEVFPRRHQIRIKPDTTNTVILVDNLEYPGSLYVYDIGGTISIVNQVPIEDYVESLLAAYQPLRLDTETLAALAIVIRTNAYDQSLNPKNSKGLWAVDANQIDYNGRSVYYNEIDKAVRDTKGMIMSRTGLYEGHPTPFTARFGDHLMGSDSKKGQTAAISIEEANRMAKSGEHAAQILAKAFPGTTIMMIPGS